MAKNEKQYTYLLLVDKAYLVLELQRSFLFQIKFEFFFLFFLFSFSLSLSFSFSLCLCISVCLSVSRSWYVKETTLKFFPWFICIQNPVPEHLTLQYISIIIATQVNTGYSNRIPFSKSKKSTRWKRENKRNWTTNCQYKRMLFYTLCSTDPRPRNEMRNNTTTTAFALHRIIEAAAVDIAFSELVQRGTVHLTLRTETTVGRGKAESFSAVCINIIVATRTVLRLQMAGWQW